VTHVSLQQLSAYLDGELPALSVESVRRHLSECAECTRRFGHMEAQEEILVRLLYDDPGDAFFESFLGAVMSGEPRAATRQVPQASPWSDAACDGDQDLERRAGSRDSDGLERGADGGGGDAASDRVPGAARPPRRRS